MCFTPPVSLTTAIIEFVVATYILARFKNYLVPIFLSVIIYILGFYQFTEFMLCTSTNSFLWARIGFITYTLLPAIILHLSIRFSKINFKNYIIYLPTIIFALISFLKKGFIIKASCSNIFVFVTTILFSSSYLIQSIIYYVYYFGFIILACVITYNYIKKQPNILNKKIVYIGIFTAAITALIPIFLIIIFPQLGIQFPSIYCEFALLCTIAALIASELYHRKKKKQSL